VTASKSVLTKITANAIPYHYDYMLEHFDEDAHGRDGHGHASKSKETLYQFKIKKLMKK
jgi:hypothetical protein